MEKMLGNGRVSDNRWALVLGVFNFVKINACFLSLVHLGQSYLCFPNPKTSKENPWVEFLENSWDLAGAWPQDSEKQE